MPEDLPHPEEYTEDEDIEFIEKIKSKYYDQQQVKDAKKKRTDTKERRERKKNILQKFKKK
jgi:hypothetical protein